MPDALGTRGLVCTCIGRKHTSNNEYPGITPAFPHAMVLTVSFALLVTGLVCHRRLTDIRRIPTRLGGCTSARLDASVGASGPHDFAVRNNIVRQRAV